MPSGWNGPLHSSGAIKSVSNSEKSSCGFGGIGCRREIFCIYFKHIDRTHSCMIETSHCPSYKFAMGGCQQNILTYSAIRALGGATKDWFAENPTLCMSSVSEVTVDLSLSEFWCSRPSKEIATVNISLQLWKQYKRLSLLVETDIIRDQRGIIDVGAVLAPVFRILSGSIFLAISSFWWGCGYLLIIGPSHWRGDSHQTVREF